MSILTVLKKTFKFVLHQCHLCAILQNALTSSNTVLSQIKKPNLDPLILSNFRPVSKLSFLLKILEKIVSVQLQS